MTVGRLVGAGCRLAAARATYRDVTYVAFWGSKVGSEAPGVDLRVED